MITKLVSVIIPSYKRIDTLREAILSVCNQTYKSIEIIVVNDCGVDTEFVVDEIKSNYDTDIKYIRHERNKGLAGARNTGIKYAKGEFIAFLDDDDLFYPNHIECLVKALETYPQFNVAYSNAFFAEYKNGKLISKELKFAFDFNRSYFLIENYIPVNALLYRIKMFDEYGCFDENLDVLEDYDLLVRFSRKNDFIHVIVNSCEVRRFSDDKFLSEDESKFHETYLKLYEKYKIPDQVESLTFKRNHNIHCFRNFLRYKREKDNLPKLTILLMYNGNLEEIKDCIKSMKKKTFYPNVEVFFLVPEKNKNNDIIGIFNDIKLNFFKFFVFDIANKPKILNRVVNEAEGEFLIFMDNIKTVFPHWLGILSFFAIDNNVKGIVTGKNILNDMKINHTFLVYNSSTGEYEHFGRFMPYYLKELSEIREFDFFCSNCFLIKKETFEQVGGFDEKLKEPLYLVEFSKKIREKGYKNYFQPYSIVEVEKLYRNILKEEII